MSNTSKRPYASGARQRQAVQTKIRILEAATTLFQAQSFESVTIEHIAKRAGVSIPTIYALYQSKRGLLRALIDAALPEDLYESLLQEVQDASAPLEHLQIAAKITRHMYDAERAQMNVLWGTYVLTPEFKEIEKERERRRYTRQEETAVKLARAGALQAGLTLTHARDILWAFTGRDLYRLFVVEQGWDSHNYETWLTRTLVSTLLKA